MTELTPEEAAASARAEEQARIRKAKREAKLKAGAGDRLNKITGLGGRKGIFFLPQFGLLLEGPSLTFFFFLLWCILDLAPEPTPSPAAPAPASTTTTESQATAAPTFGPVPPPSLRPKSVHADPEEVDISAAPAEHFYQPNATPRIPIPTSAAGGPSDEKLRQMMLGFDPSASTGFPNAGGPRMGGAGGQQDPMLQMMMQMLNPGTSTPGGTNPFGPGGANPFAAMAGVGGMGGMGGLPGMPGMPSPLQQQQAQPIQQSKYSTVFRLLHTALALALGLYIAFWTPFKGTKAERERGTGEDEEMARKFLWAFATAEAGLLTGRYFLDGAGRGNEVGGLMGMVLGFLPQPLKGRVEMVIRYGDVVKRVKGDVLVVVFVLGVVGWWRG